MILAISPRCCWLKGLGCLKFCDFTCLQWKFSLPDIHRSSISPTTTKKSIKTGKLFLPVTTEKHTLWFYIKLFIWLFKLKSLCIAWLLSRNWKTERQLSWCQRCAFIPPVIIIPGMIRFRISSFKPATLS